MGTTKAKAVYGTRRCALPTQTMGCVSTPLAWGGHSVPWDQSRRESERAYVHMSALPHCWMFGWIMLGWIISLLTLSDDSASLPAEPGLTVP